MPDKQVKVPGPDHPIRIIPSLKRVVVKAGGEVVADSREALTLREAAYPAVHYIPRKDVLLPLLERSDRHTFCPYKGDCSYYSIPGNGEKGRDAVWTYEKAFPAVAMIQEYMAFYPDRVDSITES